MIIKHFIASEIIVAVVLAIAAAVGAHVFMYAPKANITFKFTYEHHGDTSKSIPVLEEK